MDGAFNQRRSRVGIVLIPPERVILEKSWRLDFSGTNNEAEYEAQLVSLGLISKLGGKVVKVFCDSRLVVSQIRGEFEAKDKRMLWYLSQVK